MSLKYESDRERIIFDHLSPESPSMKKFRSFYVPDMSYDAYTFQDSKWILKEDVIGVNKGHDSKEKTVYVQNPDTGELEAKEIKTKWIDPSTETHTHVATTPESQLEEKSQEKDNLPKFDKKDKRDPTNVSFYDDLKKKKRRKRKRR